MNINVIMKPYPKYKPEMSCDVIFITKSGMIGTTTYCKKYEAFNTLDHFDADDVIRLSMNDDIVGFAILSDRWLEDVVNELQKENDDE